MVSPSAAMVTGMAQFKKRLPSTPRASPVRRGVVKQANRPGTGLFSEADGILRAGVAEVGQRGQLVRRKLRVVDQQVHISGEGHGRGDAVPRHPAGRARPRGGDGRRNRRPSPCHRSPESRRCDGASSTPGDSHVRDPDCCDTSARQADHPDHAAGGLHPRPGTWPRNIRTIVTLPGRPAGNDRDHTATAGQRQPGPRSALAAGGEWPGPQRRAGLAWRMPAS